MTSRCLVAVLLLLIPLRLPASEQWVIRHFGLAQGMPVSSATSAQIDADGFLWFATHDGLARFDGRHFMVFDSERFPGMGSNRVNWLYKGSSGRIYGLGDRGAWLEIDSRRVRRVLFESDPPDARVSFVALGASDSRVPSPLCVTIATGLYCETGDSAASTGFRRRRAFPAALPVMAALPGGESDWLVVRGRGIYLAQGAGEHLIWPDETLAMTGALLQTRTDQQGALVIPVRGGVLKVSRDGRTEWLVRDPQLEVVQLQIRANGDVEISTAHESFRIDRRGVRTQIHARQPKESVLRRWMEVPPSNDQESRRTTPGEWFSRGGSLYRDGRKVLKSAGIVEDVLFTDSGIVWVSTSRDGVYALSPVRLDSIADDGLAASNVYGTALAADETVWVGSLGAGLFRISADDAVRRFGESHGLPGPNIWGVGITPEQAILAMPLSGGAWQFLPDTQRFARLDLPAGLNQARLRSVSVDAGGRLWLAGSEGAWQRSGADWQQRWPIAEQELAARVNVQSLLHDVDGRVWLATDQGLFWQKDGQSHRIEALRGVAVRGLLRAHDGALWAATEGKGLQRFPPGDLQGRAVQPFGRAQGAPSNSPHSLVQDAAQQIWVNSNQGIFRITAEEVRALLQGRVRAVSPLTLGLADGLRDLEGNGGVQPAVVLAADGRVWFPNQKGIVRFHPGRIGIKRPPGRVVVETLRAGRLDIALHDADQPDEIIRLPIGARDLGLGFTAAELNTGLVRFRYRLLGAGRQQEWIDAHGTQAASFETLAPGHYRFEVQAGNADGQWAAAPTTLNLEVPAYLHESRAFQGSGIVLALLLGGWAIRWRLRRLVARARQLERVVQDRTEELARTKAEVEQALDRLAQSHTALSKSHSGIESRNQRLAEQATRLEALDRFRTRLLADVSHELRSPLMLVELPLETLSRSPLSISDRRLVTLARQNAARLSRLIGQLVQLVQAEAQQIELKFRRVELLALARTVAEGFSPLMERNDIRLVLSGIGSREWPQVFADPEHLATVISNLLDNAIKYAPAGSEIRIELQLRADCEHLRFAVQDAGPGFPPQLADRLFERFFRAEGPPCAGREGLGVGLALAQELITLHGGSMGAANRTDRSGACFWFDLPLGSAHLAIDDIALAVGYSGAAPLPVAELVSPPSADHGLLLVEDHPELAAYLADRLGERCDIVVVPSAEAAWERLQDQKFGCVVSDVVLPGTDGIDLCARIKTDQRFGDLPVLLISAKAGKSDRARGLAAGAHAWLTKPFSIETLFQAVERAWPSFGSRRPRPAESAGSAASDATASNTLDSGRTGSTPPAGPPALPRLEPLLDLANRRLHDPEFGTTQWAEQAHLSERQLRRRVTELTGMAPVAWLREQRLVRVHQLVSRAECRTLAEAGLRAGIHNAGYLYRLYRSRFGDRSQMPAPEEGANASTP